MSDGTWTYTWQHGRQLASMINDNGAGLDTLISFTYDADGLRTGKTVTRQAYTRSDNRRHVKVEETEYYIDWTCTLCGETFRGPSPSDSLPVFCHPLSDVAIGGGEIVGSMEESESVFFGSGQTITCKEQRVQSQFIHSLSRPQNYLYPFMNPHYVKDTISMGKKYEQITRLIGFGVGEEGKTMGLASYGVENKERLVPVMNNINFELTAGDILSDVYEDFLQSTEPFSTYLKRERCNIASSVQKYTERQVVEIIRYLLSKYNTKNICLAGGLFLNCPINHKLLESFEDIKIHICPCAGDDGQAVGNAFAACRLQNSPLINSNEVIPYLGISYSDAEIEHAVKQKCLKYTYMDDDTLAKYVAQCIYGNKIVGFFTGEAKSDHVHCVIGVSWQIHVGMV